MRNSKKLLDNFKRPYWSKQHGAYITLITAWVIAVVASKNWDFLQFVILIFLLSGLNFSELLAEKLKRKSTLPATKRYWFIIYLLLSVISGFVILINHPLMKYFIPIALAALILYSFLSFKRMHKSIVSELILFALFSIFGLLAYLPLNEIDRTLMWTFFLFMFTYFSISIFTVKARLNKINRYAPVVYLSCSIVLLYLVGGQTFLFYATSSLLFIKGVTASVFYESYKKLKIKTIGVFESATHLLYIFIFIFSLY